MFEIVVFSKGAKKTEKTSVFIMNDCKSGKNTDPENCFKVCVDFFFTLFFRRAKKLYPFRGTPKTVCQNVPHRQKPLSARFC